MADALAAMRAFGVSIKEAAAPILDALAPVLQAITPAIDAIKRAPSLVLTLAIVYVVFFVLILRLVRREDGR
jgi:hypothetical protein